MENRRDIFHLWTIWPDIMEKASMTKIQNSKRKAALTSAIHELDENMIMSEKCVLDQGDFHHPGIEPVVSDNQYSQYHTCFVVATPFCPSFVIGYSQQISMRQRDMLHFPLSATR